jgi:hypothetical protein
MFFPYTTQSTLAPQELAHLKSSRPASRPEILAQHLRDKRTNTISVMAGQVLSAEAARAEQTSIRRRLDQDTPSPMTFVRRGISRALMSAAERIGPEAA